MRIIPSWQITRILKQDVGAITLLYRSIGNDKRLYPNDTLYFHNSAFHKSIFFFESNTCFCRRNVSIPNLIYECCANIRFVNSKMYSKNCSLGSCVVFSLQNGDAFECRIGINWWRQWRVYFYIFSAVGNNERSHRNIVVLVHLNITPTESDKGIRVNGCFSEHAKPKKKRWIEKKTHI